MSTIDRERAARLAHDVGKYLARIARNVRDGEDVPDALVPLLIRDLSEAPGGGTPRARFEELAAGLDEPRLDAVRAALARIEAGLAGERDASTLRALCADARRVDALLRELAREASR